MPETEMAILIWSFLFLLLIMSTRKGKNNGKK